MGFKDMIQRDIKNIFLNQEEFGETHVVNQKEMSIVIDNNELLERKKGLKLMDEGLHRKQLLIYVSSEEFGKLPGVGKILMLDNKVYSVVNAIDENGIYSITLEANKS